jgi:hypothetical protein
LHIAWSFGEGQERQCEAELVRVPSNGCGLFPEVQREDRESARGVVAVKLLEDRQLGTALETPGRSDIEKDHAALQILQD